MGPGDYRADLVLECLGEEALCPGLSVVYKLKFNWTLKLSAGRYTEVGRCYRSGYHMSHLSLVFSVCLYKERDLPTLLVFPSIIPATADMGLRSGTETIFMILSNSSLIHYPHNILPSAYFKL